jgi:hypothetical protein
MNSSFHNLISFLPLFCNCQLNSVPLLPSSYLDRLPSRNSTQFFFNWTVLYNHFTRTTQKTQPLCCWEGVCIAPLLDCCLRIRCRWNVFTESLPSNEHLFWLDCFCCRASCHSIIGLYNCTAQYTFSTYLCYVCVLALSVLHRLCVCQTIFPCIAFIFTVDGNIFQIWPTRSYSGTFCAMFLTSL